MVAVAVVVIVVIAATAVVVASSSSNSIGSTESSSSSSSSQQISCVRGTVSAKWHVQELAEMKRKVEEREGDSKRSKTASSSQRLAA